MQMPCVLKVKQVDGQIRWRQWLAVPQNVYHLCGCPRWQYLPSRCSFLSRLLFFASFLSPTSRILLVHFFSRFTTSIVCTWLVCRRPTAQPSLMPFVALGREAHIYHLYLVQIPVEKDTMYTPCKGFLYSFARKDRNLIYSFYPCCFPRPLSWLWRYKDINSTSVIRRWPVWRMQGFAYVYVYILSSCLIMWCKIHFMPDRYIPRNKW